MEELIPWFGIILCGLPMVILGYVYWKWPPKKVNHLYGYRTNRSMKNQEVWDYANKIGAQMIIYSGVITMISGLVPLFTEWEHAHFIPLGILMITLIGGIWYCEKQLDKRFDKDGNPI